MYKNKIFLGVLSRLPAAFFLGVRFLDLHKNAPVKHLLRPVLIGSFILRYYWVIAGGGDNHFIWSKNKNEVGKIQTSMALLAPPKGQRGGT